MNNLKRRYEKACNDYVNRFCEKQDMTFEGWVNDIVGEIALCSDFFFNLQDIIWDINSEQKEGVIIDWYYAGLQNAESENPLHTINYHSWTKGLTYDYLEGMERDEDKIPPAPLSEGGINAEKTIDDIIGTSPVMESLKKTFMDAIDEYNSKQVTE